MFAEVASVTHCFATRGNHRFTPGETKGLIVERLCSGDEHFQFEPDS
jgi:hypothetical protein